MMRPADPPAGPLLDAAGAPVATRRWRGPGPTARIVIGLVLGILVGWLWPTFGADIRPLADAFLRMIKMIVGPLLFSTLVVGIAGTGDLKAMGRIGAKAILYFEVATTFALVLGLGLVNLLRPGAGVAAEAGNVTELQAMAARQQSAWDIVLHLFPTSLFDALARNDVLQVVVFGDLLRRRPGGERRAGTAGDRDARLGGPGDVQGHRLRDVVRADRRDGGDRGDRRQQGPRHPGHARQADRRDVSRLRAVPADRGRRRAADRAHPDPRLHPRRARAGADRLHHRQQRSGAAQGARGDGALRRPEEHRRFRAADRLQLQPGRLDVLPVDGQRLRRPARRRRADLGPAAHHDADADADQQGRRRRAARVAGGPDGDAHDVRPGLRHPARGRGHPARHRPDPRHGPYRR